uniref:Uncharacterized protein n=1 Tax=Anguilla anguilla TaxID=7936 RepID=A0A0E9P5A0_ANGAN
MNLSLRLIGRNFAIIVNLAANRMLSLSERRIPSSIGGVCHRASYLLNICVI